jgi:hypothetical protein
MSAWLLPPGFTFAGLDFGLDTHCDSSFLTEYVKILTMLIITTKNTLSPPEFGGLFTGHNVHSYVPKNWGLKGDSYWGWNPLINALYFKSV